MNSLAEVRIRAAVSNDWAAIRTLLTSAFAGVHGRDVVAMVSALDSSGAARASLVATHDEVVVGHVQLSRGWVDARRELVEVLILSPLSVLPEHQRCGIGTRLIAAALAEAERQHAPAVFLEGDWRYYGARGFSPGAASGFARPSDRIPGRAFQVALLASREDWMSGRLIYPEAFWSTGTVGLRDPGLAEIEALAD